MDRHERLTSINREAKAILESRGTGKEEVLGAMLGNLGRLASLMEEGARLASEVFTFGPDDTVTCPQCGTPADFDGDPGEETFTARCTNVHCGNVFTALIEES